MKAVNLKPESLLIMKPTVVSAAKKMTERTNFVCDKAQSRMLRPVGSLTAVPIPADKLQVVPDKLVTITEVSAGLELGPIVWKVQLGSTI